MNMGCLSTYLRLLYFLSTMCYNFQNISFVILLLNLYFINFYAIVNEIVSLISFSLCKCIEIQLIFCTSILYPATLLNSFISYNSIFSGFLRIFNTRSCHLQIQFCFCLSNTDNISFSFPVAQARPSSTMLSNGKSRALSCS